MQKLTCEMCGGNDLVKQNGLYVCQHCGTKYTVEEARQLFKKGTVEIDVTWKLDNLYVLARRAIDEKDYKAAQQYYEEIMVEQPEKWEPVFHAAYFKTMNNCETDDVIDSVQYMSNKLKTTFELLENDAAVDQEESARHIASDIKLLEQKLFEITLDRKYGKSPETKERGVYRKYIESIRCIYGLIKELTAFLDNYNESETIKIKFDLKKLGVRLLCVLRTDVAGVDKEWASRRIREDCSEIIAYDHDSEYEYVLSTVSENIVKEDIKATNVNNIAKEEKKKGACYVATAVYGSYDCPQVWVLRRFRDEVLLPMCCGRLFVKTYYAVSPTLLKHFGNNILFKTFCITILDLFIKHLKTKGFSDKPYDDTLICNRV